MSWTIQPKFRGGTSSRACQRSLGTAVTLISRSREGLQSLAAGQTHEAWVWSWLKIKFQIKYQTHAGEQK